MWQRWSRTLFSVIRVCAGVCRRARAPPRRASRDATTGGGQPGLWSTGCCGGRCIGPASQSAPGGCGGHRCGSSRAAGLANTLTPSPASLWARPTNPGPPPLPWIGWQARAAALRSLPQRYRNLAGVSRYTADSRTGRRPPNQPKAAGSYRPEFPRSVGRAPGRRPYRADVASCPAEVAGL